MGDQTRNNDHMFYKNDKTFVFIIFESVKKQISILIRNNCN